MGAQFVKINRLVECLVGGATEQTFETWAGRQKLKR
jgi:hypothetical protein